MTNARRLLAGVLGAGAAVLLLAAPAGAATSEYHPTGEARTFEPTAGDWTGSTDETGVCLVSPVLCPAVTNQHQTDGGASGATDGHLRTSADGLAQVLSSVSGTWSSPEFTYSGVAGATPDSRRVQPVSPRES